MKPHTQNILEHSANTAVGLLPNGTALLVTTDGYDGCSGFDPSCGANAFTLAYVNFCERLRGAQKAAGPPFLMTPRHPLPPTHPKHVCRYLMKDYFNVSSAMGMDQGGSTTMWVQGLGYVTNPGQGVREIFSALFVEEVQ